jgi:hypothetical protein
MAKEGENERVRGSLWTNRGSTDENGLGSCLSDGSDAPGRCQTDDLGAMSINTPAKRRRITLGRGCLQRYRRRRRRKPRWYSWTDKVREVLLQGENTKRYTKPGVSTSEVQETLVTETKALPASPAGGAGREEKERPGGVKGGLTPIAAGGLIDSIPPHIGQF